MKIKVAILEQDKGYLNRFVSALSSKYSDKLELYSFSDSAVALSTLNDSKMDVLIANDSFEIDAAQLPKRCGFAYFVDSADIDMVNDRRTICKYQKIDLIYKQILSIYSENAGNITGLKITDDACKLIAFSSPCGGTGTTSMAVGCAISCAKAGKKALYLNLEKYGSSDIYFSGEGQFDISDVVFALKSKKSNLSLKLESCVKQDPCGVYFYSQSKVALDMMELNGEDVLHLISELKLTGSYDCIIVDGGFGMDKEHLALYGQMNDIVIVGDGSETSNAKIFRAMKALAILEQNSDSPVMNRMQLIYNKFSSKTGKALENMEVKNLGGAPRYEHATEKQVVEQLSQLGVFAKITE